jgi:L-threonylcarbamoyladenylate synthase
MQIIKKNKNIKEIVAALKNGAVLVLPTDTVYGLVCDATNKKATEKIFKIKKRPKSKPLPVFVKDIKMAKELAEITKDQEKILNKKWPGRYTFVLKRKKGEKLYGVDKNTIALRIPKYKFLNDLFKKIDKPLVQTSVNISGQPSLNNIKEIVIYKKESQLILKDSNSINQTHKFF